MTECNYFNKLIHPLIFCFLFLKRAGKAERVNYGFSYVNVHTDVSSIAVFKRWLILYCRAFFSGTFPSLLCNFFFLFENCTALSLMLNFFRKRQITQEQELNGNKAKQNIHTGILIVCGINSPSL